MPDLPPDRDETLEALRREVAQLRIAVDALRAELEARRFADPVWIVNRLFRSLRFFGTVRGVMVLVAIFCLLFGGYVQLLKIDRRGQGHPPRGRDARRVAGLSSRAGAIGAGVRSQGRGGRA